MLTFGYKVDAMYQRERTALWNAIHARTEATVALVTGYHAERELNKLYDATDRAKIETAVTVLLEAQAAHLNAEHARELQRVKQAAEAERERPRFSFPLPRLLRAR